MKKLLLLLHILCAMYASAQIDVQINSGNPRFPFPQFLDYTNGKTLGRDNAIGVTDIEMERDIREAYQIMMNRAIYTGKVIAGTKEIIYNPHDHGETFETDDVSEGDGYSLLAAAYMADKHAFDGIFIHVNDEQRSVVEYFQKCGEIRNPDYPYGDGTIGWEPGQDDAAADGDWDIALALLVAYMQWPDQGIKDDCGNIRLYKELAEDVIRGISDTTFFIGDPIAHAGEDWVCPPTADHERCPYGTENPDPRKFNARAMRDDKLGNHTGSFSEAGYLSGHIGFDGYPKIANTVPDVSGFIGSFPNNVFEFDGNTLFTYTFKFSQNKPNYIDYVAPSYYKEFGDFLSSIDSVRYAFNIYQYRRAEASSDWLMGQLHKQGKYPTVGNFTVNADGSTTTFNEDEKFAEDSRNPWRTLLNYVWHGNPTTTWNPKTHEVEPGGNTFEYDNAMRLAQRIGFRDECAKLGNDPTELLFSGPALMCGDIEPDGSISPGIGKHINYNLGSASTAIVAFHDDQQSDESKDLLADWYRQLIYKWDATVEKGVPYPENRYIQSLPVYFHGWFRVLGLLMVTGNYQSPEFMSKPIQANLKVYNSVDKTVAYAPTIKNGIVQTKGDIVNYTISYRNYASVAAENTTISFPIPDEYDFKSATGNYAINGNTIEWNIGTVNGYTSKPNENGENWMNFDPTTYDSYGEVKVSFVVKENTSNSIVETYATINADNVDTVHTSNQYPNNYTSTMERNLVDIGIRSLEIKKRADRAVVNGGDIINYDIEFENSSKGGWLNGGRKDIRFTYALTSPDMSDGSKTQQYLFRMLHGADEPYINPGNYRVSYFLNDQARLGLFEPGVNENGWHIKTLFVEGGDIDKVTFSSQEYTFGQDEIGKWNQRLIVQFPDTLMSSTQHTNTFFAKAGEANEIKYVHKGIGAPFRIMIEFQAKGGEGGNCVASFGDLVTDDWSFPGVYDKYDDKKMFTPITPAWFNPYSTLDESLQEEVNEVHVDACAPIPTRTYDRFLIEEFDGYVWRRIMGRGPVPGRELSNVCIRDTLPEGLIWQGFTDAEALGINAEYNPVTRVVTWCVPAMLPGANGKISYSVMAEKDCSKEIKAASSAWIFSNSDSPIGDETSVTITCKTIPVVPPQTSTIYKKVDKETVIVDDELTYSVEFMQSDGTISEPDLKTAKDWTVHCGDPIQGFDKIQQRTIAYDYSHGTNGVLVTKVHTEEKEFSLWFRFDGSEGKCGDGLEMRIKNSNCGEADVTLRENGTIVGKPKEKLSYRAPVDTLTIRVKLEDDKLYFWLNNDNAIPYVFDGITLIRPGYVGFSNMTWEEIGISYWYTNFDSAFDVELTDYLPESVEFIAGSETVLYDQNGAYIEPLIYDKATHDLSWKLVEGKEPMLYGDSVAFELKATVIDCGNGFIYNSVFANMLGQPENLLGAGVNSVCVTDKCTPITAVELLLDNDLEICEGDEIAVDVAVLPLNDYNYELYVNGVKDKQISLPYIITKSGKYAINAVDKLTGECMMMSDEIEVVVHSLPKVEINGLTDFCASSEQDISISPVGGEYKYKESNASEWVIVSDIDGFTIDEAGDYTFDYSVEVNGCSGTAQLDFEVKKAPEITFDFTGDYCFGDDITLSAKPSGGMFKGNEVIDDVLKTSLMKGTVAEVIYSLDNTTSPNGCPAEKETEIEIIKLSPPTALDVSFNREKEDGTESPSLVVDESSVHPDARVMWVPFDGTDYDFTNPYEGLSFNPQLENADDGVYTYGVYQEYKGCKSVIVTVLYSIYSCNAELPELINDKLSQCEGDKSLPFEVKSNVNDIFWFDESIKPKVEKAIHTGNLFFPNVTEAETYVYYASSYDKKEDCFSPPVKVEYTLHEQPKPQIKGVSESYCHIDKVIDLILVPSGGKLILNNKDYTETSFIPASDLENGNNTFKYTVTDEYGCEAYSEFSTEKTFVAKPEVESSYTFLLEDIDEIVLSAKGNNPKWRYADSDLETENPFKPQFVDKGTYHLQVIDYDNGCSSLPVDVIVEVVEEESACGVAKPVVDDITICEGEHVMLVAVGNKLKWYDETLESYIEADSYAPAIDEAGDYLFYVSQTDIDPATGIECESAKSLVIATVNPQPEIPIVEDYLFSICASNGPIVLKNFTEDDTETIKWECTEGVIEEVNGEFVFAPPLETFHTVFTYTETAKNGGCEAKAIYHSSIIYLDKPELISTGQVCANKSTLSYTVENEEENAMYIWSINDKKYPEHTEAYYNIEKGNYSTSDENKLQVYTMDRFSGCESETAKSAFTVPRLNDPYIIVQEPTVCFGEEVLFESIVSVQGFSLTYYKNEELTEVAGTGEMNDMDKFYAKEDVAGDYTYYAVLSEVCSSKPVAIDFTVLDPIAEPLIEVDVFSVCENKDERIDVESENEIHWMDSNGKELKSVDGVLNKSFSEDEVLKVYEIIDGCKSTATEVTVTVQPRPEAPKVESSTGYFSNCFGDEIPVLKAYGETGAEFLWQTSDGEYHSERLIPTGAGVEGIAVFQSINGCQSDANEFEFTFYDKIAKPVVGDNYFCKGSDIQLAFENTPLNSVPVWRESGTGDDFKPISSFHNAKEQTDYEIAYQQTMVDVSCLSEVAVYSPQIINNPEIPEAVGETDFTVCFNETQEMQVKPVDDIVMVWHNADAEKVSESDNYTPEIDELSVDVRTQYYVYAQYKNCLSREPLVFTQTMKAELQKPVISGEQELCNLDKHSTLIASSNVGDIYWYLDGEQQGTGEELSIDILNAGKYTYNAKVIDGECESESVSFSVSVAKPETLRVDADIKKVCVGTPIHIEVHSSGDFKWDIPVDAEFIANNGDLRTVFAQSGKKQISVTDQSSSCQNSGFVEVYVSGKPDVDFSAWQKSDDGIMEMKNTTKEVPVSWIGGSEIPQFEYTWDLGTEADPDYISEDNSGSFEVHQSQFEYGPHKITLETYSVDYVGCEASKTKDVFVNLSTGLWLPNAITTDITQPVGVREFKVFGHNMETFEISIYDNFGNLVWYSNQLVDGMPAESWTGTTENGTDLQTTVYTWKMQATFKDGTQWEGIPLTNGGFTNMGYIYLIR